MLGWRTGSSLSQVLVLAVLLVGVTCSLAVSLVRYDLMPVAAYLVWLLLGAMLLRSGPLLVLVAAATGAAVTAVLHDGPLTTVRVAGLVSLVVFVALLLLRSSRQRSGLRAALSEAMLADSATGCSRRARRRRCWTSGTRSRR